MNFVYLRVNYTTSSYRSQKTTANNDECQTVMREISPIQRATRNSLETFQPKCAVGPSKMLAQPQQRCLLCASADNRQWYGNSHEYGDRYIALLILPVVQVWSHQVEREKSYKGLFRTTRQPQLVRIDSHYASHLYTGKSFPRVLNYAFRATHLSHWQHIQER